MNHFTTDLVQSLVTKQDVTVVTRVRPKVVKSLRENPYIFTFYSFPKSIWRSIFATRCHIGFDKARSELLAMFSNKN